MRRRAAARRTAHRVRLRLLPPRLARRARGGAGRARRARRAASAAVAAVAAARIGTGTGAGAASFNAATEFALPDDQAGTGSTYQLTPRARCHRLRASPPLLCTPAQPYASGILAGLKRVENRTWGAPGYKPLPLPRDGGLWLVLHSSQKVEANMHELVERLREAWPAMPPPSELPLGAILGCMRVSKVVPASALPDDPQAVGPWCWVIDDVAPLDAPMYGVRGKLSLWVPPAELKLPSKVLQAFGGASAVAASTSSAATSAGAASETGATGARGDDSASADGWRPTRRTASTRPPPAASAPSTSSSTPAGVPQPTPSALPPPPLPAAAPTAASAAVSTTAFGAGAGAGAPRAFRLTSLAPGWGLPPSVNEGCVGLQELLGEEALRGAEEAGLFRSSASHLPCRSHHCAVNRCYPPPRSHSLRPASPRLLRPQVQLHSYLLDLDWLLRECPALGRVPKVLVLHGDGFALGASCLRDPQHAGRFVLLEPPTPKGRGCFHSKTIVARSPAEKRPGRSLGQTRHPSPPAIPEGAGRCLAHPVRYARPTRSRCTSPRPT